MPQPKKKFNLPSAPSNDGNASRIVIEGIDTPKPQEPPVYRDRSKIDPFLPDYRRSPANRKEQIQRT